MTNPPDVLVSATSMLKGYLERIAWEDISVGTLDVEQLLHDRGRAHVLLLGADEAKTVWDEVESLALDMPLFPLVVGDPGQIPKDASTFVRLAPILSPPIEGLIQTEVRGLLQRSAALHRELASVDPSVKLLTQNAVCEWVRCSVGIVGLVKIVRNSSVRDLTEQLDLLRVTAHATVDRIPAARLSTDDLWTLLLIVAVPWTRDDLVAKDIEWTTLTRFASDTMGSRKLVMSAGESVRSLVGPVATSGSNWYPSSDDPLRDRLTALSRDTEELQALDLLFKKRFSGDDVDRLIAILGREP